MGATGPAGSDGAPGAPGEVSQAQLDNAHTSAISGSSANSNAVSTLDASFADPELDSVRQKLNELVSALRR